MNYKYTARSQSDPNGESGGLGYHTQEAAQRHADCMNGLRQQYPAGWNTDFWKTQPEEWKVYGS